VTGKRTGSDWFAVIDRERVGPLSEDELTVRLRREEVSATTLVWRRGMNQWRRLDSVSEFSQLCPKVEVRGPAEEDAIETLLRLPEAEASEMASVVDPDSDAVITHRLPPQRKGEEDVPTARAPAGYPKNVVQPRVAAKGKRSPGDEPRIVKPRVAPLQLNASEIEVEGPPPEVLAVSSPFHRAGLRNESVDNVGERGPGAVPVPDVARPPGTAPAPVARERGRLRIVAVALLGGLAGISLFALVLALVRPDVVDKLVGKLSRDGAMPAPAITAADAAAEVGRDSQAAKPADRSGGFEGAGKDGGVGKGHDRDIRVGDSGEDLVRVVGPGSDRQRMRGRPAKTGRSHGAQGTADEITISDPDQGSAARKGSARGGRGKQDKLEQLIDDERGPKGKGKPTGGGKKSRSQPEVRGKGDDEGEEGGREDGDEIGEEEPKAKKPKKDEKDDLDQVLDQPL
jgi:hypothetical protein